MTSMTDYTSWLGTVPSDIRCSYIFVLSFPFVLRSILILTFDHTVTLVIANLKILRTDTDTTHTYNKNH